MKTISTVLLVLILMPIMAQDFKQSYIMFPQVELESIQQPDLRVLMTYYRWCGNVIWCDQDMNIEVYSDHRFPNDMDAEIVFPIQDTICLVNNGWYKAMMKSMGDKYHNILLFIDPGRRSITTYYDEFMHFEFLLSKKN